MMCLLLTTFELAAQQYEKQYQYGDTVRATVHPDPGWELVGWFAGDELLSEDYTLEYVVTSDMVIRVVLRRIMVTVTVVVDPPGSGTVTGAGEYLPGSEVILHVEPRNGYTFKNMIIAGAEVPNPHRFIANDNTVAYASMFAKSDARGQILIAAAFVAAIILIISFFQRISKNRKA